MRLLELKLRIAESTYAVDPTLVAAAVLRRDGLRLFALPPRLSPDDARTPRAHGDRARRVS